MKEKYIVECKVIQQNCLYTAEAHHYIASVEKRKSIWFEVIPAVCAAITAALVASNIASNELLIITIISSVTTAVASVLNPSKSFQNHLNAAKNFTAFKHDARFLHEATALKMSDDAFIILVENLHEKYNELLKAAPPTTSKSFRKAQESIQSGDHDPDRDQKGKVK